MGEEGRKGGNGCAKSGRRGGRGDGRERGENRDGDGDRLGVQEYVSVCVSISFYQSAKLYHSRDDAAVSLPPSSSPKAYLITSVGISYIYGIFVCWFFCSEESEYIYKQGRNEYIQHSNPPSYHRRADAKIFSKKGMERSSLAMSRTDKNRDGK